MTSRRIVLVQDFLRSGGTERQTILLARAFRDRGHDASVVTFRPGGILAPTLSSVPQRVLQPFDTRLNWFGPGLGRTLRRMAPDVVLLMGRMAHSVGSALPAALPATRVVATLRTGKPLPAAYRRVLWRCAHAVANSAESATRLRQEIGLPARQVSVIHNGLVFPASIQGDAALRARQRALQETPEGAVVLLCVGMLRPEKNQRALIEAAALLPRSAEWRLWLAGDGPERSACAELAERLGVGDRVKLLGFRADPRPLYAAADVAVLGSRAESLSNFLIEAQAHGLPVVATRATGVVECVRDGRSAILVAPGDKRALAAAIGTYVGDLSLRQEAGRLATEYARTAFDPQARADDYLHLFERLIVRGLASKPA
jgi:glycosyltransferase involved in cell wall biosynthesis